MTSDARPFTSSAETEASKRYSAVVTLGMLIVRELGLEDGVDTLGRWMSHRIAELIQLAEQASTEVETEFAKRECTDLILRVWERRKYWPKGQPLSELSRFLHSVSPEPYHSQHQDGVGQEGSWMDALPRIRALHKREDEIALHAALADLDLNKDREWLKDHPNELTEEERNTITWLIAQQERMREPYYKIDGKEAPYFLDMLPEKRAQLIFSALDEIKLARQKIFEIVRKGHAISSAEQDPVLPSDSAIPE